MITVNRIIKAQELFDQFKELLDKYPDSYVCVGKYGDKAGRYDHTIIDTRMRDNIIIINVENYNEHGILRAFKQR